MKKSVVIFSFLFASTLAQANSSFGIVRCVSYGAYAPDNYTSKVARFEVPGVSDAGQSNCQQAVETVLNSGYKLSDIRTSTISHHNGNSIHGMLENYYFIK